MNLLAFDCETTIFQKGNVKARRNRLVSTGIRKINDDSDSYEELNFLAEPHGYLARCWQVAFDWADVIIGFNLKFDLHWARRTGVYFEDKVVWDCQLAQFVIQNQQNSYPSLNDVAEYWGLGTKLDVVKLEYWDKGIDTDQIPDYILSEYLEQDVNLTYLIYKCQMEYLKDKPQMLRLIKLQMIDLLCLEEMEDNGLKYDSKRSLEKGDELQQRIAELDQKLADFFPNIPVNWGSGDQLSACLYGGVIVHEYQIPNGVFKTGARAGQPKLAWVREKLELPRLVEPLDRSEVSSTAKLSDEEVKEKKGYRVYKTDEKTLLSLKAKGKAKEIIEVIRERSELEKLRGTYYHGFPALCEEMDWEPDMLFGTFNQVVARTGRLSSNKPNMQNCPPEMDALIISRF